MPSRSIFFAALRGSLFSLTLLSSISLAHAKTPEDISALPPTADSYRALAGEIDKALIRNDIDVWFPRCVDHVHGGYIATWTENWKPDPKQTKGIVFQSRMTWFTAQVAEKGPEARKAEFHDDALHGIKFLNETMWDSEQGGFYWELPENGIPMKGDPLEKHAYGVSFAIYACANVARVTQDPTAPDLGKRAFLWLDQHAHDPVHGGYYEALARDGTPLLTQPPGSTVTHDQIGTPYGYKSMNTHIHLLESFSLLYKVWPDPVLKQRVEELLHIVRDQMCVNPGCLNYYYTADFRPVPFLDSFGHDMETGFLMTETADILGMPDDAATWKASRELVDHALDIDFNGSQNGFYEQGPAFGAPTNRERVWWTQAEGLNSLLLMHEKFGSETPRYWKAFLQEWEFIRDHQLDPKYGGWYGTLLPNGEPKPDTKGNNWKAAYHSGRALMNIEDRLNRLAQASANKK